MDLRKEKMIVRSELRKFKLMDFALGYAELCSVLNEKYKPERTRTSFEDELFLKIRERTKINVLRSLWVGKRNVDFLIPGIAGKDFKGIAIEVDGDIHNKEFKMKKDKDKLDMLVSLKICPLVIENCDIKHPSVLHFLGQLKTFKKIDTRAKQRLLRNIFVKTLISHKDLIKKLDLPLPMALLRSLGEL